MSIRCFVLVAALAAVAGCSDNHGGQQEVSGKVTLKGEPLALKDATITFTSADGTGSSSGGPIANGQYRLEPKHGLKPGKYLVRITAGDGKTVANEEEAAGPGGSTNIVSVDRIPAEWNTNSDKYVEVKSNGPNNFDFDIPNEYIPRSKKR